ncbi:MAG: Mu-like prophage major head subunit gpT family protein [Alphaproteobacteria bacterium]|nr:Mu-like prophage major head subunit gpT family protein [Alphaproteobacteria bacterium]
MAIINAATLNSLTTSYSGVFKKAFDGVVPASKELAIIVPATTGTLDLSWIGQYPELRKWVGDRTLDSIKQHNYSLVMDKWESTVSIPREAIEDDQYGVYSAHIQELGYAAKMHMDKTVFEALKNGDSETCYDSQYFFDTDHPVGRDGAEVSVSNRTGTTGTKWWLMDCSRPLKPFIFAQRKTPELQVMTANDDEQVFTRDIYRYGVRCRDVVGYGIWQSVHQSQETLNITNLETAWEAMRARVSDEGRPLGIHPTHLIVPPSLEVDAIKLIERELVSDTDGGGNSNHWYKRVKVVSSAYLA